MYHLLGWRLPIGPGATLHRGCGSPSTAYTQHASWCTEDPSKPGEIFFPQDQLLPPFTPSVHGEDWCSLSCSWWPGYGDGEQSLSVHRISLLIGSLWAARTLCSKQADVRGLSSLVWGLFSTIQRTHFYSLGRGKESLNRIILNTC